MSHFRVPGIGYVSKKDHREKRNRKKQEDRKMLRGGRCEACKGVVEGPRAAHPQTKYCGACAKLRRGSQARRSRQIADTQKARSVFFSDRKGIRPNRRLARSSRYQLSSILWMSSSPAMGPVLVALPLLLSMTAFGSIHLSLESINVAIQHLGVIIIELTELLVVLAYGLRHISEIWPRF